jgi:hypothetical protein
MFFNWKNNDFGAFPIRKGNPPSGAENKAPQLKTPDLLKDPTCLVFYDVGGRVFLNAFEDYGGPPVIKARVFTNLPPGAPEGGPEEGGGRYQHFEEIVGALRAQFFRSELMHVVFQLFFEVFASGASKSG